MSRTAALKRLCDFHDTWTPPVQDFCERIRHVVLIGCSSRGGSSVFTEMLRHHAGMIHLPGEINPFLAMADLTWPLSGTDSDALDATHATPSAVQRLSLAFAHQAGRPAETPNRARMARDLVWRLTAQWPDVSFDPAKISRCVDSALSVPNADYAALLQAVRTTYPGVNPWYADLDPQRIQACFPDLPEPKGPPCESIIEEAPFVMTQPWRPVTDMDLQTQPFVFKTPSNAYRLPFFRAVFPNARIQLLHLTRNPAAAINGLVDGWRFRGFHAHRMDAQLQIDGYDESLWWKYDLPPGWRDWTRQRLVEVAGFQWARAHTAILDHTAGNPIDTFRLRFEDIVGPPKTRHQRILAMLEWMGIEEDSSLQRVIREGLPPVMATVRPRQRRWFARADLIDPVLMRRDVATTANALGYTDRSQWT